MALWDEGAHRRGRRLGAGAYGGDNPGQRVGRGPDDRTAARKGEEVHADAGYLGVQNTPRATKIDWQIARKRGQVNKIANAKERAKAQRADYIDAIDGSIRFHCSSLSQNRFLRTIKIPFPKENQNRILRPEQLNEF